MLGPVLLAGDSHVEGLAPPAAEVARAFGREFSSDYVRGLRADQAAEWLPERLRASGAAEVWLQLGTNDLEDPGRFADAAEALARAVPADVPLLWWLPPPATREPFEEAARRNAEILEELRRRGGFVGVVDSRRYADPRQLKRDDGVHYTAAGYAAWAKRAALDSCLRAVETHGAPIPLLVAIADAETGGTFDPSLVHPTSRATGLFQITGILLVDRQRVTGDRFSLASMTDPVRGADVSGWYVRRIVDKLGEVGVAEDLGDPDYVGVVAIAYNAGLGGVLGAVRTLRAAGRPITPAVVAALTPFPERTFYAKVQRAYFPGGVPAGGPTPELPQPRPAPGRRSRGPGLALALAGVVGLVVLSHGKGKK